MRKRRSRIEQRRGGGDRGIRFTLPKQRGMNENFQNINHARDSLHACAFQAISDDYLGKNYAQLTNKAVTEATTSVATMTS